MYIKKVHIEYRIEMTLDDSFKLLTPVGIQDRHFRRYYMENFITSLKPTKKKKKGFYPIQTYAIQENAKTETSVIIL